MLVVANGAYKSGSTWLLHILREMSVYRPIPRRYANRTWGSTRSLDRARLGAFLAEGSYREYDYLAKNHFDDPVIRDLLVSYPDVRVFNIRRDIRDVVVSYYHEQCRKRMVMPPFEVFYWLLGRYRAYSVDRYHQVWSEEYEQVYVSSFEELKTNFVAEVQNIGKFIGKTLTPGDCRDIKDATALKKLRKDYDPEAEKEESWFRKGQIGGWENWLSSSMVDDLEGILEAGLTSPVDKTWHKCLQGIRAVYRRGRRMRNSLRWTGKCITGSK